MPEAALISLAPRRQDAAVTLSGVVIERGGVNVLNKMDLSLGMSGTTAIMGPNGAGKSLTLRLLAGLMHANAGSVVFHGGRPAARDLALVFQRPVLLRRTVRANLDHALATYGVRRCDRPRRIEELLAMAGMSALAERPARALSGGEQQRLALVRALGAEPRYLLLDEPTASLDPQATAMIEALITHAASTGIRVVLVTHDQGQAKRLADDVVFLHRGRVVEAAPAERFFDRPETPEARAYLLGDLLI